jgi:hypothetical protein
MPTIESKSEMLDGGARRKKTEERKERWPAGILHGEGLKVCSLTDDSDEIVVGKGGKGMDVGVPPSSSSVSSETGTSTKIVLTCSPSICLGGTASSSLAAMGLKCDSWVKSRCRTSRGCARVYRSISTRVCAMEIPRTPHNLHTERRGTPSFGLSRPSRLSKIASRSSSERLDIADGELIIRS